MFCTGVPYVLTVNQIGEQCSPIAIVQQVRIAICKLENVAMMTIGSVDIVGGANALGKPPVCLLLEFEIQERRTGPTLERLNQ